MELDRNIFVFMLLIKILSPGKRSNGRLSARPNVPGESTAEDSCFVRCSEGRSSRGCAPLLGGAVMIIGEGEVIDKS